MTALESARSLIAGSTLVGVAAEPGGWLEAYWMARYYGFIEPAE